MASLGLMQYKSAGDLRADDENEAQRTSDADSRKRELIESSLGSHIRRSWEEAKMAKQEVDYRLLDCLRRRKGEYDPSKLSAIKAEGGSAIYMMLTTTKCRAASAWVRDILMPSTEKPWGLDPTPLAEVPPEFVQPVFQQFMQQALQQAQESGEQPDPEKLMEDAEKHIRKVVQEKAREAAERHEELINDQMAEGEWDEAFEGFIDDFVTYPAGFVRGHNLRRVSSLGLGWKGLEGG